MGLAFSVATTNGHNFYASPSTYKATFGSYFDKMWKSSSRDSFATCHGNSHRNRPIPWLDKNGERMDAIQRFRVVYFEDRVVFDCRC